MDINVTYINYLVLYDMISNTHVFLALQIASFDVDCHNHLNLTYSSIRPPRRGKNKI